MELKEAYDIKELGQALKEKGLIAGEEMAYQVYVELKAWLVASALKSATPYDDLIVPFLNNLDAIVIPKIDKIDGVENR